MNSKPGFRRPALVALALVLAGPAIPVLAQDTMAEARLRGIEGEVRALQRKVFPGPDGKFFTPEITAPASPGTTASGTTAGGAPVTSAQARQPRP